MNKFKFFLIILLFFSFVLSFPTLALAADLNIDCPASPTVCSKSGADPLFSSATDGFWYPGKSITKTLNLKNSGPETREMAIKGTRTSTVNILENVMHISIVGGTTVIWSGSVADFYGQEKIGMGTFAPAANLNYNFTVFMSSGAGDDYQSKETVFDLTLGFWGGPIPTPTPTPAPGVVLGAGVSAPVCGDAKPGSAPTLTSAVAGTNSITLFWTQAAGPLTYYLAAYGISPGVPLFGNPNIGGAGTTSYTVSGLSGGVTYYFKVRAGNSCMPGDYSNELSATPGGGFIVGPAAGFIPGVLGVQEEEGEGTPSSTGPSEEEILGLEGEQWFLPGWLKILLGAGVGVGIIFILLRRLFSH